MENGFTFGNYRLIRRLGRGGMAEVFLAIQSGPHNFERLVAIKSILPHLAENEQFVDLFMEEARLSAMLSHPNIAHIYDFGIVENRHYIAMEYIDGVDLRLVLRAQHAEPIPFEHAARIIADICGALHYAHSLCDNAGNHLNLVHRDISPHNILVAFNGAVKVVDFGLAKAAHHLNRTRPGLVRGKFTYMSPEQVTGQPLDGRSDIFCAGIVLYELCTNSTLLPRDDAMEAMRIIRSARFPRPLREGLLIPSLLEQVLERCLARDRELRYATAAEMQMDLEAYLRSAHRLSNAVVLGDYFQSHFQAYRPPEEAEVTRIQQLAELRPRGHEHHLAGSATASLLHGLPGQELARCCRSSPADDREPLVDRALDSSPLLPPSVLGPLPNSVSGSLADSSLVALPDSALEPLPDSILEPLPDSVLEPLQGSVREPLQGSVAEPSPLLQAMASAPHLLGFADTPPASSSHLQEQRFTDLAPTRDIGRPPEANQVAPDSQAMPGGDDGYLVALLAGANDSDVGRSGSLHPRHWPTPAPLPQSEEQVLITQPHGAGRQSWAAFSPQRLALIAMVSGLLLLAALVGYCVSAVPDPVASASSNKTTAPPDAAAPLPDQATVRLQAAADLGWAREGGLERSAAPVISKAAPITSPPAPQVAPTPRATPARQRPKKQQRAGQHQRPRRGSSIVVEELPLD